MTDKDRIRLAEAMGIADVDQEAVDIDSRTICTWNERDNFNPFTDANDDYAVLEWARQRHRAGDQRFYPNGFRGMFGWAYKVGDYARAALKVLDNERQTFNNRTGTP